MMKKILIGIMLIATVLSHTSCKNDVARALSELYGKKMSFEWEKVAVYPDTVGVFLNESAPAKIFVSVDPRLCTSCLANYIVAMSTFISRYDSLRCCMVMLPRPLEELQPYLQLIDMTGIDILFDIDSVCVEINSIKDLPVEPATFLLDREDKIVLVGDPVLNSDIRTLYEKVLPDLIE